MKKISKTKLIEKIENKKGKILNIVSIKKNGEQSSFTGIIKNKSDDLGYLTIRLMKDGLFKKIDTRKIKQASVGGEKFKVV